MISPQLLFSIYLAGWREWLTNWQAYVLLCTAFVLLSLILCYKRTPDIESLEPVELSGIEAFDAEYYELYQTGLWLLGHRTEAPYDDL